MIKKFDFDFIKNTEQLLKQHNLGNKKLLVGVSGGVDSVVLFHHLLKVSDKLPLDISVCYVHHGISADEKQNKYRDRAFSFVKRLAEENRIPFFTNDPKKNKSSDEEYFRNLRNDFFVSTMSENKIDILLKAHHRDDLLETRLIRLIRGVGDQGFESMTEFNGEIFRPLLTWSREEIENYAKKYQLDFVKDPSNKDGKYFRNWIRNSWLKDLEAYRPGAKSSLTRSLENISQMLKADSGCDFSATIDKSGIIRSKLILLNKLDQRRVFAFYLNKMNVKNYSHSHIDEILKRLDSSKKALTFHVMGCDWVVDTEHISIK
ncbi:MAG: tRNA lysidine(34) synthetase TilS [Bdellovibrionota bacterium]